VPAVFFEEVRMARPCPKHRRKPDNAVLSSVLEIPCAEIARVRSAFFTGISSAGGTTSPKKNFFSISDFPIRFTLALVVKANFNETKGQTSMMIFKNYVSRIVVAAVIVLSLLLLQTSHARAGDKADVVTFTKWVTGVTAPTVPGTPLPPADPGENILLLAGFTGGAAPGLFYGEVLYRKVSANKQITQLWPIYQVSAGNRSFTALIQGGTNNATGVGLLEGVIMDGWRTGSRVRVRFQAMTNCAGAPAGTCFQGTIRILRDEDED